MSKKLAKLTVKAGAFGPCATEDNPRRFIGADPVEVNATSYYLRRLADGDLVEVTAKEGKK